MSFGQDGSYSAEAIVTRCNAELANSFGNLVQRVLSMISKNLDGDLSQLPDDLSENFISLDGELPALPNSSDEGFTSALIKRECKRALEEFGRLAFSQGLEIWIQQVFECNKWIDKTAPWALYKSDFQEMKNVLAQLFLAIRDLAITLLPVAPTAMSVLLDHMGALKNERDFKALSDEKWYENLRASGFRLAPPTPIFPRLEMPADEV